jgi:XTP/dITP diphosphohydrolase
VGNALLKARALARQLLDAGITASTLADDSGLEVDELENRPGIHSARYGGDEIGWPQRRAALLAELDGVPEAARTARFLCTMALVKPDGDAFIATGEVEGRLLTAEQGTGGFGYDSLFYCPPLDRTFAEITEDEKNVVSHRRRAADALLEALRDSE